MTRRSLLPPPSLSGILAMAAAAVLVTWLVTHPGGGLLRPLAGSPAAASTPTTTAPPATTPVATAIGPVALTAPALLAAVRSLGRPVFWLGPEAGRRYELRRATNGNVFLRYLPPGVAAGAARALRTVGTYPLRDAYAATQNVAHEPGAIHRGLPGGWLAVYRPSRPTNVYLARKGLAYQIEVFDPSAAAVRNLVAAGRVRRAG